MRLRDFGVKSGLWKAFGSMAALWESLRALEKGLAMDWMWVGNWRRVLESDCQPVAGCRPVSVAT